MFFNIFIVIASLVILLVFHELGHFIFAKKFGVKVEEFGIGIPPRIIGKKIGETIYSLNLLPLGAFVKIEGEESESDSPRSFSQKPAWQRALILFGGILAFWIVAFFIFFFVFLMGVPTGVSDEMSLEDMERMKEPPSIILMNIGSDSPAEIVGLQPGDKIISLRKNDYEEKPTKIKEVQEFIESYKGKEIILEVKRGSEIKSFSINPRISPPENEGPIGVVLSRVAILSYSWHESVIKSAKACVSTTYEIIRGLSNAVILLFKGETTGVEVVGPIGIGQMVFQHFNLGINYFLQFIALITLYLALFNLLPIPAVDGGRLLFLGIEKIKGSPINRNIERRVNGFFFILLIILMLLVTTRDIINLF